MMAFFDWVEQNPALLFVFLGVGMLVVWTFFALLSAAMLAARHLRRGE